MRVFHMQAANAQARGPIPAAARGWRGAAAYALGVTFALTIDGDGTPRQFHGGGNTFLNYLAIRVAHEVPRSE